MSIDIENTERKGKIAYKREDLGKWLITDASGNHIMVWVDHFFVCDEQGVLTEVIVRFPAIEAERAADAPKARHDFVRQSLMALDIDSSQVFK